MLSGKFLRFCAGSFRSHSTLLKPPTQPSAEVFPHYINATSSAEAVFKALALPWAEQVLLQVL